MSEILQGDCLELMKTMDDNSVDAIVTDPPYGLSFMGKKWDYDVPSQEIWEECLRVLKPGGYLLSFAGTRTYHRMAVRIEDAGFEIRDMIAWVYGSGFPKSLNIGKAVDKLQGNERLFVQRVKRTGKPTGTYGAFEGNNTETKGTSEWEGWGTALKPSHEPICMARKPLAEKTVAENVLKYGTGGINIDECRVSTTEEIGRDCTNRKNSSHPVDIGRLPVGLNSTGQFSGRFPANFIHDGSEEVLEQFPHTVSGKVKNDKDAYDGESITGFLRGKTNQDNQYGDSGSAARFFYCAKASVKERTTDNNHPTVKPIALMEYLIKLVSKEGATVLDPFGGSGSTALACQNLNRNYIIIEREKEYVQIINSRITANLQDLSRTDKRSKEQSTVPKKQFKQIQLF